MLVKIFVNNKTKFENIYSSSSSPPPPPPPPHILYKGAFPLKLKKKQLHNQLPLFYVYICNYYVPVNKGQCFV